MKKLTPKHRKKLSEARLRGLKSGTIQIWNKGKKCPQISSSRMGEDNPSWRGGKSTRGPYIVVIAKEHPRADRDGYVLEHRIVVENHLGRYLQPGGVVHHKNHIKTDNRLENLEVMERGEHHSLHMSEMHEKRPGFVWRSRRENAK